MATRKKKVIRKKSAKKKTAKKKTAKKKAKKKIAKANPVGRPTDYDPVYHPAEARKLCSIGSFINTQLAEYFGVNVDTIYEWQKVYPEFSDALKAGKDIADDRVERALYERAIGYSHPDTHISNFQGAITQTDITKHYPPESVAGIFWLTNRRRGDWKRNLEPFGGDDDTPPPLAIEYKVKKAVNDVTVTRGT